MASADHEAEVLLQVQRASIDEIARPAENAPPTVGTRRTVVDGVELLVLALTFTPEQLEEAAAQLEVPASALAATPGEPIVVAVCGDYRVPIIGNVTVRRGSPLNYVFYVPTLPLGVNLHPTTPPEVLEAFEFIVKSYGRLEDGGIPPVPAAAAAAVQPPQQEQQQQQYQDRSVIEPNSPAPLRSMYGAPPPPGASSPQTQYYAGGGSGAATAVGPAPVPSHASLEEQQAAAVAAARSAVVYAPPARLPGSQTLIMQTVPDVQPQRTSTRIAHGIGEFARRATGILSGGSDLAARGVRSGAQHVVDHTQATQNPVHVPEAARGHVRRTRMATKGAVAVTGGFAAAVVGATSIISDQVSSRLRPMVPQPHEQRSGMDDVKEVGIAAVGAAAAITDAAMDAARTLLSASCDGVTQVVTHKLGGEAGELTENGLGLAQDAVASAGNMRKAGLKSIAKATLKETAKKTVA